MFFLLSCDRELLLAELDRVLSRAGWLAVFDSEFLGLVESPALLEWLRSDYWSRLPPCPRNPLFEADHSQPPFSVVAKASSEAHVPMTAEAILRLITTQGSTVNAVTSGAAELSELEECLRQGLRSNFPDAKSGGSGRTALARFVNPLWLLRKGGYDTALKR